MLIKEYFESEKILKIYETVIIPNQKWLKISLLLIIIDCLILGLNWLHFLEFTLGLLISINLSFLGFKLLGDFFDNYLLGVTLEEKTKINTELLFLANFLSKSIFVLIVIFIFAQIHQINIIGLIASLGIVGAAIAFASQKIIEQILWSVVLYIDSPFIVGEYIRLSDGTLGRVEGLGWRSTKIRLSGKNTLTIVPNSNLAQLNIENLSKAQRGILMIELTFFNVIPDEEKALINQLILKSTEKIIGVDHQLTKVIFENISNNENENKVQAQAIFYLLGAAENSMELRTTLLDLAKENILKTLNNYGIKFQCEEKILNITQPMNL